MRICLVSREYPPDTGWGGVGAYTYQIAHGLVENGHQVDVVALSAERGRRNSPGASVGDPDPRIKVHRVDWEDSLGELNLLLVAAPSTHFVLKTGIALWRKFLELHREQSYDVVEAPEHLAAGLFHGITGEVPLVVKLHTPHSKFVAEKYHGVLPTLDNQLICLFERITMLLADSLCSPSVDLAKFVSRDLNIEPQCISTVRNPVDIDRFCPDGAKAIADHSKLTVLFVGRLEPRKGVQYLVDAIPAIYAKHQNVQFVFVGADTNTAAGGGSMLAELKRRLNGTGYAPCVSFVPHVPLDQIPDFYRSADICVVPSLYENAPYTCIEAMACGKPVVTTSAGGSGEYVADRHTGLVVPAASAEALSDAVAFLVKQQHLRQEFGANARSFVTTNLDRRRIAREMEELYRLAIAQHTPSSKLYKKPADSAVHDALELLCATEQMLFYVLYKLSFEFRCRYWSRFLFKRPRLCLATAALAAATGVTRFLGRENNPPRIVNRLRQMVYDKQVPRFGRTLLLGELASDLERLGGEEPSVESSTTTASHVSVQ
jgi:glycosyltransferase involved in cell wall biosynthesis